MRILFAVLFFGLCFHHDAHAESAKEAEESTMSLSSQFELPWFHHLPIIQSPAYNAFACASTLESVAEALQAVNWNNFSNEVLQQEAPRLLKETWKFRQLLRQKIPANSEECALKTRALFHQLRDFEDYVSEFLPGITATTPESLDFQSQPVPVLDTSPAFYRLQTTKPLVQFQPGDVMLARGISFISAIITQISDNRSHFSHAVTVATPNETVESYIGSGVSRFDMPFALKNENVRLLVLRPRDQDLAKKAGAEAAVLADKKLPYDYALNDEEASAMSCVEIPVQVYRKASEGRVLLPEYPAKVTLQNPNFLNRLGIRNKLLRTPDDLEIDPRFELVADWKDLRLIRDSRHKDAVLSEMIRWVSELKYGFHDNWRSWIAMKVIKPLRSTFFWPTLKRWFNLPTIDEEVPTETFGLMVLLDQVGETLLQRVRVQDQQYMSVHGRPMTNQELRNTLESYRVADAVVFAEDGKSDFHHTLHP